MTLFPPPPPSRDAGQAVAPTPLAEGDGLSLGLLFLDGDTCELDPAAAGHARQALFVLSGEIALEGHAPLRPGDSATSGHPWHPRAIGPATALFAGVQKDPSPASPALVVRRGEEDALARVQSDLARLDLVGVLGPAELVRQSLLPRGSFGMTPSPAPAPLEAVCVLKGQIEARIDAHKVTMTEGMTLVASGIERPIVFEAPVPAELIYVCSRPSFQELMSQQQKLYDLAIEVERVDGYTARHCQRVQEVASAIGRSMGLPSVRLHHLLYGAYLHDLGKVVIPKEVLQKPSALSAAEWALIRQHPEAGADMLRSTHLAEAAPILEQHHERVDGKGYPKGLLGDEVLLEAQIVAAADSFDAMSTNRVYRAALTPEKVLFELQSEAGRHLRRDVIAALLDWAAGPGGPAL